MKIKRSKIKGTWINMRQRCNNKNYAGYKKYGAKGTKVCERWNKFENFLSDMGLPPADAYTIDLIDPKGHYEPGNCRWATMKEQQNNRTNNRLITFNGETKTIMQWSEHTKIARKTIFNRIARGWSLDRVFTEKAIRGRNQSFNILYTFNGESLTIKQWAAKTGIKQSTLQDRLNRYKWPIERALTADLVIGRPR